MSKNIVIKFTGTTSPSVDNFTIVVNNATSTGLSITSGTNPHNGTGTVLGTIGLFDNFVTGRTIATGVSRTTLLDGYQINNINCGDYLAVAGSNSENCTNQNGVNIISFNSQPKVELVLNYLTEDGNASLSSELEVYGTNGTPNPSPTSVVVNAPSTGSYSGSLYLTTAGTYSFTYTTTQYGGSVNMTGKSTQLNFTDC